MALFNYKKTWAEKVKNGEKLGTIRTPRKNPIKPGEKLYHYKGLRTKHCEKLGESVCMEVVAIRILADGVELNGPAPMPVNEWFSGGIGRIAGKLELDSFAQADGFDNWAGMQGFFKDKLGETLWWIRWTKESLVPCE